MRQNVHTTATLHSTLENLNIILPATAPLRMDDFVRVRNFDTIVCNSILTFLRVL